MDSLAMEEVNRLLVQYGTKNISPAESLKHLIDMIFENAVEEQHLTPWYALLAKHFAMKTEANAETGNDTIDLILRLFKKAILNKCQTEFDLNVADENAVASQLLPLIDDMDNEIDPDQKSLLSALIEKDGRRLRARRVGIVRFIGEVYMQGMLTTNIMMWCVSTLSDAESDAKLELMCVLLGVVAPRMELKTGDPGLDKKRYRNLDTIFEKMQTIVDDKKNSARVRFMLIDLIKLRQDGWLSQPKSNEVKAAERSGVPDCPIDDLGFPYALLVRALNDLLKSVR